MAIKRPDIYEHNNPNMAFVDSHSVRGGKRKCQSLNDLYALAQKSDQLSEFITVIYVIEEGRDYLLTSMANISNSDGWQAIYSDAATLQSMLDNNAVFAAWGLGEMELGVDTGDYRTFSFSSLANTGSEFENRNVRIFANPEEGAGFTVSDATQSETRGAILRISNDANVEAISGRDIRVGSTFGDILLVGGNNFVFHNIDEFGTLDTTFQSQQYIKIGKEAWGEFDEIAIFSPRRIYLGTPGGGAITIDQVKDENGVPIWGGVSINGHMWGVNISGEGLNLSGNGKHFNLTSGGGGSIYANPDINNGPVGMSINGQSGRVNINANGIILGGQGGLPGTYNSTGADLVGIDLQGQGGIVRIASGGISGITEIGAGGLRLTSGWFINSNVSYLGIMQSASSWNASGGTYSYMQIEDSSKNFMFSSANGYNLYGKNGMLDDGITPATGFNVYVPSRFYYDTTVSGKLKLMGPFEVLGSSTIGFNVYGDGTNAKGKVQIGSTGLILAGNEGGVTINGGTGVTISGQNGTITLLSGGVSGITEVGNGGLRVTGGYFIGSGNGAYLGPIYDRNMYGVVGNTNSLRIQDGLSGEMNISSYKSINMYANAANTYINHYGIVRNYYATEMFSTLKFPGMSYSGTFKKGLTMDNTGLVASEEIIEFEIIDETTSLFANLTAIATAYPTSAGYRKGLQVICPFTTPPTIYKKCGDGDDIWLKIDTQVTRMT